MPTWATGDVLPCVVWVVHAPVGRGGPGAGDRQGASDCPGRARRSVGFRAGSRFESSLAQDSRSRPGAAGRCARCSSAASRSSGSGEATSIARAGDRVRERQPRGVQELALEARAAPGAAVLGVAHDRVADRLQVRRGSGACGRSRGARAAAWRSAARARASKCVTRRARRRRCRSSMRVRTRAVAARAARRSCPLRAGGRPSTSARYSRAIVAGAQRALQRRVDRSERATHEQARTCRGRAGARCPARSGPAAGRDAARSACASVPSRWPRAGCTTTPGRLVDHEQVLVLVGDRESGGHRVGACDVGPRLRRLRSKPSPQPSASESVERRRSDYPLGSVRSCEALRGDSITSSSSATPSMIAASARLKGGQPRGS